jgi:Polysaccharide pyruvyl transferase
MSLDQYVILTGGKNNAGDFLIKSKAKRLFASVRPDRTIVDYDGWKPLTSEQLEVINQSKALILVGGPALQGNIYPGIYPLTSDLNDIKVPLLTMGIGYKEENGHWQNTVSYPFTKSSVDLLEKIRNAGYKSSVRDYHTLNVLLNKGYDNFVMSGCPAMYELQHIGGEIYRPTKIERIAFSLGVSYIQSASMRRQMKSLLLALSEEFGSQAVVVYFHHRINEKEASQLDFISWLKSHNLKYEDISGSEKRLEEVYGTCDFHVGYRVHAHIHTMSVSRPGFLINEDSRGKGFYTVLGGAIIDGYYSLPRFNRPEASILFKSLGVVKRIFHMLRINNGLEAYERVSTDVLNNMKYEINNDFPRLRMTRKSIDTHFENMQSYLRQLP